MKTFAPSSGSATDDTMPTTGRTVSRPKLLALLLALALVAAACGDSAGDAATDTGAETGDAMEDDAMEDEAMEDEDHMDDDAMEDDAMEDDAMEDEDHMDDDAMDDEDHMEDDAMEDDAMSDSAVLGVSLTDVDGNSFTLADFAGTPVVVENFATWCPNCRSQLGRTQEAAAQAGDNAVFVALSTETDIDAGEVADYAAENGFDNIRFAVLSPEALAAFNDEFGGSAINPPSTPHWVIDAEGHISEMITGDSDAADILALIGLA